MKVNGSLVFDAASASEIQNLRVEKVSSRPAHQGAVDTGRLIYDTTEGKLYQGTSTAWVAVATGGDATALQNEVDAIETSLGAIVGSNGVFLTGAVTGPAFSGSEASLTELLQALSDYANANNQLSELDDVAISALGDNHLLQYNSTTSKWENAAIGSGSGVQAYDAGLDALAAKTTTGIVVQTGADTFTSVALTAPAAGITITNADGTAGSPTFALANDLAAVEGLNTTGFTSRDDATGTWVARSLVAPSAGITISNVDGVSGNPTFALANDLAALEGLTTTGYIVRTGDGTATTRSIAGNAGRVVVANGDGVSTDTAIDLATVTQGSTGSFVKVTLDGYGRVTGNTAVVTADITALVDAEYVNVSGDTMTGNLNMGGSFKVTGLASPTGDTDAVNKAYADALVAGLSWKTAVRAASVSNETLADVSAGYQLDGVTLSSGDRVLLKSQTAAAENGIYVVQPAGAPVRASDMNAAAEFDGSAVFVYEGTVNQGSGWTETATVTTVGTDPVVFSQFTGGALYTWGTGLVASGNTININLGAGIAELPSDEVGLDIESGKAVQLTSSLTGGQLTFVLDGGAASGLEQSASGLKISANGVTNAMIVNDTMVVNGDAGTGSLALGGTLEVKGDSVQGITTSVNGTGTFTVTATTATSSQLGVAKFNTGDFAVTAGDVTIKAGGVDNAQLAFSTITVAGTTGSDAVALGETLTFAGATTPITVDATSNTVTIAVADATTTTKGLASFAAADFSVTAGAVSAVAKSIDAATDVDTTTVAPSTANVLGWNGTNWVPKKIQHVESFTAQTSVTATHGLGQQFVNVTVVADAGGGDFEVVIPQSIVMGATSVTVTFNTSVTGKVIINGIA